MSGSREKPPLTRGAGVIHDCITMKTATVRELRNNFADVGKWIEHGETVTITRNGTAFATLAPVAVRRPSKAFIAQRYRERKPVGRKLTQAETDAFWSALRD